MLLVDEAHATGVFGRQGRGVAEHFDLEKQVHVRVGTLSKALGCMGGFVAGSRSLIEWLVNRARPYVFSTAMPAANAAAAMAALDIVENEPERRVELLARADGLRAPIGRSRLEYRPLGKPDHSHYRGPAVASRRPIGGFDGARIVCAGHPPAHRARRRGLSPDQPHLWTY